MLFRSARDTYDGVRGGFVQRVGKLVLDGTENWLTVSVSEILTIYYIRLYSAKTKHNMISSHFVYNKSNDVYPSFHIDAFNALIFNYENGVGGVDNFKSWLAAQAAAGTPVTVYYELAQPIAYNRKVDITAFDGRTTVIRASKGTPPFLAGLSYYGRHLDDVASPLHGEGDFQGKLPHIRLDFA